MNVLDRGPASSQIQTTRKKSNNLVQNQASVYITIMRIYTHGQITFAEFDASVQGWINHVRYADTWGLHNQILKQ